MPREPESILVLRLGGIGEVLAITPALREVRARFRRAWITLMAQRPAHEVARGLVNEVVEAESVYKAGMRSLLDPSLYREAAGLARRVLRRKYDLFLDFHHLFAWRHAFKPLLAAFLSRAPRRVGFGDGFFLTDRVPDPDDRPMVERNRPFLAALGIELSDPSPSLAVDPADQAWADHLLETLGIAGKPIVALSPGSSRPVTRWGIERFSAAAQRLSPRGPVVVIGTAAERGLGDEVGAGSVNLAGLTTVGQLAALLRRCALLVSNDSGPVHIARALGTPVVGIFRPREYLRWGSYGDARRFRALYREGPGAEEGRTLPLIAVDEVVRAAEELLDANPPRP